MTEVVDYRREDPRGTANSGDSPIERNPLSFVDLDERFAVIHPPLEHQYRKTHSNRPRPQRRIDRFIRFQPGFLLGSDFDDRFDIDAPLGLAEQVDRECPALSLLTVWRLPTEDMQAGKPDRTPGKLRWIRNVKRQRSAAVWREQFNVLG